MINKDYTKQTTNNQVPRDPVIYITENDPRNTIEFLRENPGIQVVSSKTPTSIDQYKYLSENTYDLSNNRFYEDNFPNYLAISDNILQNPPQNLNIDSITGFRLQTDTNDGSVYYVANLTFDGVDDAYDYEVRINIA
jgi:hypothetical protein